MKCNKRLAQFLRMLVSVVLIIGMMPSNNTMVFATNGISYGGGGSSVVASVTLTLNPPANTVFDGNPKEATVSGYPEGVTGLPAKPVPEYTGTGYSGYSSTAPTNVGSYTAKITWGGATATVDFSITAANGSASVVRPTAKSLTYTGDPQVLVTAGSTSTGTIDYRLGDIGLWGGIPSAIDHGTYRVYYRYTPDGNHTGGFTDFVNVQIAKATWPTPDAPTVSSKTETSVTLVHTDGYLYSVDGGDYGSGYTFNGLSASTEHSFRQKVAGDGNHNESAPSAATTVTTNAHVHTYVYTLLNNHVTIEAHCDNTNGGHVGEALSTTWTISAPSRTVYGGSGSAAATVTRSNDNIAVMPTVKYIESGDPYELAETTPPTEPGSYQAFIEIGECRAYVDYTIGQGTLPSLSGSSLPTINSNTTYTGSSYPLAIGPTGSTSGCSIRYAAVSYASDPSAISPESDCPSGRQYFEDSIPTVTAVGYYRVWYYVSGGDLYDDSESPIVYLGVVRIAPGSQTAPTAPEKASATSTSVTLVGSESDNYEYKRGNGDWQDSPVFTGLNANTEYTFYRRLKAIDFRYNASDSSEGTVIRTNVHTHTWSYTQVNARDIDALCLNEDGQCNCSGIYYNIYLDEPQDTTYPVDSGQSAVQLINNIPGLADPVVQYYYSNNETHTGVPTLPGSYIAKIQVGDLYAQLPYTIAKGTIGGSSFSEVNCPTLTSDTDYSPSFATNPYPLVMAPESSFSDQVTVYYYASVNSAQPSRPEGVPSGEWTTSIPSVDAVGVYYVYFILYGGDYYTSYGPSYLGYVTVSRASQATPSAPEKASATSTSVTLVGSVNDDYQYRIGNGDWQNSPVFTGLNANTEYTFYRRLKDNIYYDASLSSQGANISTEAHVHEWSYSLHLSETMIIDAVCQNSDGQCSDTTHSLILVRPFSMGFYPVSQPEAHLEGSIPGVELPTIHYKTQGDNSVELDGAPSVPGFYRVYIQLGGVEAYGDYAILKGSIGGSGGITLADANRPTKNADTTFDQDIDQNGYPLAIAPVTSYSEYLIPKYALGANATEAPNTEYSTSIPSADHSGTYYVWYYFDGGDYFNNPAPVCLGAVEISKASQSAPSAPVSASVGNTSIILNPVTGCEYSLDGIEWQYSNVFEGLVLDREYTFYQRYYELTDYYASPASAAARISTTMCAHTGNQLTFNGDQQTLVTREAVPAGYEMRYVLATTEEEPASIAYTSTTIPSARDAGTYYIWYKGVNIGDSSETSAAYVVATIAVADQEAPGAPVVETKTTTSVTLDDSIPGCEYCIEGGEWQDSPVFTGLLAGESYNFARRKAATSDGNYNASPTSAYTAVQTIAHVHDNIVSVSENTITIVCENSDGGHYGNTTSYIRINAPTLVEENSTGSALATITSDVQGFDANGLEITYRSGDSVLDQAPYRAGSYTASITAFEHTATVSYRIAPPYVTPTPTPLPYAYIQEYPTGLYLPYDGTSQLLATAGSVYGGYMEYALGSSSGAMPVNRWDSSVPAATEPNTYYVWYRAEGDFYHRNGDSGCVTATIYMPENMPTPTFTPTPTLTPTPTFTPTPSPIPEKLPSYVVKSPVGKDRVYNGEAQKLATAGSAGGGTMMYTLGTAGAPDEGWSSTVPSGIEVGNYYIWFKVIGDAFHLDSNASCVTAEIAPAGEEAAPSGYYEDVVVDDGIVKDITGTAEAPEEENPLEASIDNSAELETLLEVTPEEKDAGVNVWLEVIDVSDTMPVEEKEVIEQALDDYTVGVFVDVSLFKKVGEGEQTKVTGTNGAVKISIVVPEELREEGRNYAIVRLHDGVLTVIDGVYDPVTHLVTFETDQFSSYAVIYREDTGIGVKPPKTGQERDGYMWFLLCGLALMGMGATGYYFKKRNSKRA